MSECGFRVAVFGLLTLAGCGTTLLLAICFWMQQGSNSPYLFISTSLLSFFAPIGFGYFLAKDEPAAPQEEA